MSYPISPNGLNHDQLNGMIKENNEYKIMLDKHQNSNECTQKPDCPRCRQIKGWIVASDPSIP